VVGRGARRRRPSSVRQYSAECPGVKLVPRLQLVGAPCSFEIKAWSSLGGDDGGAALSVMRQGWHRPGDNDQPYDFGHNPSSARTYPLSDVELPVCHSSAGDERAGWIRGKVHAGTTSAVARPA
jgi:hypothetical protein